MITAIDKGKATNNLVGEAITFLNKFSRQIIVLWLALTLIDLSMSHWLVLTIHKGWFSEVNPLISFIMPLLGDYTFMVLGFAAIAVAAAAWFIKSKHITVILCFSLLAEAVIVVYQSILLITFYWG